jgi:hypothetical protein
VPRRRSKIIEVYAEEWTTYRRKKTTTPTLQGRWWDQKGIRHEGDVSLFDVIGPGMGMALKGGEIITVTVEVQEP